LVPVYFAGLIGGLCCPYRMGPNRDPAATNALANAAPAAITSGEEIVLEEIGLDLVPDGTLTPKSPPVAPAANAITLPSMLIVSPFAPSPPPERTGLSEAAPVRTATPRTQPSELLGRRRQLLGEEGLRKELQLMPEVRLRVAMPRAGKQSPGLVPDEVAR